MRRQTMLNARPLLIAGLTGAALVLVNIAPPVPGLGSQAALAKNDKDHGIGGDNGNRGGNSGGNKDTASTEDTGAAGGKSASAPGHNKSSDTESVEAAKTPGLDAKLAGL